MRYKKILVTGGSGFIGSNLCEALASIKDCDIYSLDNYFTGSESNHVDGVSYINGKTSMIGELVNFEPDLIYHLGEYSRVEQSFDDLEEVWDSNIQGTYAVLEFTRKVGCKIVYAGSSTKFGDKGATRTSSPYAWTKGINTELVKNYGDWFGVQYAITYFYNVYGRREIKHGKYATLISLFAEKMRNGEPLPIVSPGSQKRNFTYIDDVVDALLRVGDKGFGDEFGIGSKNSYTIYEVADLFGGDIEILPARKGNRMSAEVITKNTEDLGWEPKNELIDYVNELKNNGWINK